MPRQYSFNARTQFGAEHPEDVPIVLVTIRHEGAVVARLSTDPTERFEEGADVKYGTRSRGLVYDFVLMSATVPDDQERTPQAATLDFEVIGPEGAALAQVARSVIVPAEVTLELVMASNPNALEGRWTELKVMRARGDQMSLSLEISREPFTREAWPAFFMTQSRFPGMFR